MQPLLQVQSPPVPVGLPEQVYKDIKDGAFAALLIMAVSAVWFSRVWGKEVKAAIADFTQTMKAIAEQTKANTVAVEELSHHVHEVDSKVESLQSHIGQVEKVAQGNKVEIMKMTNPGISLDR